MTTHDGRRLLQTCHKAHRNPGLQTHKPWFTTPAGGDDQLLQTCATQFIHWQSRGGRIMWHCMVKRSYTVQAALYPGTYINQNETSHMSTKNPMHNWKRLEAARSCGRCAALVGILPCKVRQWSALHIAPCIWQVRHWMDVPRSASGKWATFPSRILRRHKSLMCLA